MKTSLLFATGNKAKLAQARFIVEHFSWPLEIISAKEQFGAQAEYEEIGDTVEAVALQGATDLCQRLQSPIFTEDTDFRVEALDDLPGIRAGAFLKEHGRQEILRRLHSHTNRRAIINSAVGFAAPGCEPKVFKHTVHGSIANEERSGSYPSWISVTPDHIFGGGYNAIFIPDGFDRTLAEISPEEALSFSYRETTLQAAFRYFLEKYPKNKE